MGTDPQVSLSGILFSESLRVNTRILVSIDRIDCDTTYILPAHRNGFSCKLHLRKMTTVSRHPPRRFHAPVRGQVKSVPLRGRNRKRQAKGLRIIHCHQKVAMVQLDVALKSDPARAICGWLKTKKSHLASRVAKTSQDAMHLEARVTDLSGIASATVSGKKRHSIQRHLQDVEANLQTKNRNLRTMKEELANVQRAENILLYIIATKRGTDVRTVQKHILPVYSDIYGKGIQDGKQSILIELTSLKNDDSEYGRVLDLLMNGQNGERSA